MKFEIYEKYLAEQQANAEKGGKLHSKNLEVQAKLDELVVEYEATMVKQLTQGTDEAKALDALDINIDGAKRERDRAAREYEIYNKVSRDVSVTKEDIIASWNSKLNPQHYEKKIAPALEKLEVAKKAYYEAMCGYFDTVHEIEDFREVVSSQLNFDFPYHFHIKNIETTAEYDRYFIRQEEINEAQSRNR